MTYYLLVIPLPLLEELVKKLKKIFFKKKKSIELFLSLQANTNNLIKNYNQDIHLIKKLKEKTKNYK